MLQRVACPRADILEGNHSRFGRRGFARHLPSWRLKQGRRQRGTNAGTGHKRHQRMAAQEQTQSHNAGAAMSAGQILARHDARRIGAPAADLHRPRGGRRRQGLHTGRLNGRNGHLEHAVPSSSSRALRCGNARGRQNASTGCSNTPRNRRWTSAPLPPTNAKPSMSSGSLSTDSYCHPNPCREGFISKNPSMPMAARQQGNAASTRQMN